MVRSKLDGGYEIDKEYVKKLSANKIIAKGPSIFENKIFDNIRKKVIDFKETKAKPIPKNAAGTDPDIDLKRSSKIESEFIRDQAFMKERKRLARLQDTS